MYRLVCETMDSPPSNALTKRQPLHSFLCPCPIRLLTLYAPAILPAPAPALPAPQPCALVLQPSGKIAATQRMQLAEAPAAAAACSPAVPSGCWEYTDEGTAASAQSLFEADLFTTHCAVAADPHHAAQDL